MSPRNVTEEEFKRLVQNRDRDPVERVRGTAPRSAMTNWKDSPEANHSPTRKVSGSNINPRLAPSPYKSKLEAAWANYLHLQCKAGGIENWWYEPLNFRLPGSKNFYKPDFLVLAEDGLTFYEIKGRNKSDDRSLVKIKTAAGLTSWARFVLVKRVNGQWEERTIL